MTPDRSNRWLKNRSLSGDVYDATYESRAAAGENVHGEADFVERFAPASVLDAGCGTGRVDADFLTGPSPTGPFTGASLETAQEKKAYAATRRQRWFGE